MCILGFSQGELQSHSFKPRRKSSFNISFWAHSIYWYKIYEMWCRKTPWCNKLFMNSRIIFSFCQNAVLIYCDAVFQVAIYAVVALVCFEFKSLSSIFLFFLHQHVSHFSNMSQGFKPIHPDTINLRNWTIESPFAYFSCLCAPNCIKMQRISLFLVPSLSNIILSITFVTFLSSDELCSHAVNVMHVPEYHLVCRLRSFFILHYLPSRLSTWILHKIAFCNDLVVVVLLLGCLIVSVYLLYSGLYVFLLKQVSCLVE